MSGIVKIEKSITTGNENSVSQVFLRNSYVNIIEETVQPFCFDMPTYSLGGASKNYYGQVTDAITANLNNVKNLTYYYSANTFSLSGATKIYYNVYKLDHNKYIDVKAKIESGFTGDTGLNEIISSLSTPFCIQIESASAITIASAHTITLPDLIKIPGEFKKNTFFDKNQYFVDTIYEFEKPVDRTLGAIYKYSAETEDFELMSASTASTTTYKTVSPSYTITASTFNGIPFKGAFFSYFTTPNKPNIYVVNGQPAVYGQLSTFNPIFGFNNVEDGDKYKLQISYDINDTSFTGNSVTVFDINRQEGDADYIRTYSIALNPDTHFNYRIGNTKQIEDIFEVKQSVTTWSAIGSAITVGDGSFTLSGIVYGNDVNPTNVLPGVVITIQLISSFAAANSSIELEADSKYDSGISGGTSGSINLKIGTIYTTTSSASGTFSFSNIYAGIYSLTASSSGFTTQTSTIILNSDTNIDIVFGILWGNAIKTFGELSNITFL